LLLLMMEEEMKESHLNGNAIQVNHLTMQPTPLQLAGRNATCMDLVNILSQLAMLLLLLLLLLLDEATQ